MTLWKAGFNFKDVRINRNDWKELKTSGILDFGQLPMLELENGETLFQTIPILTYLGKIYGLIPDDPLAAYKGEKALEYAYNDFLFKVLARVFFMPEGSEK